MLVIAATYKHVTLGVEVHCVDAAAVPVQRALQTQPLQQPALRRDGATVGPGRAVAELSRLPTVLAAENARLCGTPLSGCYRALDTLAHLHSITSSK
eukprot:CAMPEP_0177754960 /NCGR_PEP_ID=MMETSP0491_2-20121128/2302_1 /TAXON_ID=63592 /ORGANISM="Tetraselmis chuii, Strain PLY429" /LENGTH=96 /DNA_ID=CAMNT_0019270407 /DNA_START=729 /DNA_END=1019 /DNA_ORIENTATION=-